MYVSRITPALGCAAVFLCVAFCTAARGDPVVLSLPDTTVEAGTTFRLPVRTTELGPEDRVTAFNFAIVYPPDMIEISGNVERGPLMVGMQTMPVVIVFDTVVDIAWAGTTPIVGSGVLFYLKCTVKPNVPDQTVREVKIVPIDNRPFLNEGLPPSVAQNGVIRVYNPAAVAASPEWAGPTLRAWPNPFNASVTLQLDAPDGLWRGTIFNAAGQVVRRWTMRAPGLWRWDGRDEAGRRVGSGTYSAVLVRDGRRVDVRFTLLR